MYDEKSNNIYIPAAGVLKTASAVVSLTQRMINPLSLKSLNSFSKSAVLKLGEKSASTRTWRVPYLAAIKMLCLEHAAYKSKSN